jgi:signal transduction histidine kinase
LLSLKEPLVNEIWSEPVEEVYAVRVPPHGILAFGKSPRLPFDEAYRELFTQLSQGILTRLRASTTKQRVKGELRDLLMQAPVAIALVTGPEHRYEIANPSYIAMVGRDVVGKSYLEAFPEVKNDPIIGILDGVYREGVPFAVDEMLVGIAKTPDGERENRYFKFGPEPVRRADDAVYGMMVLAIDVTDGVVARESQVAAHNELLKANEEKGELIEQLKNANRAKDDFIAVLGHELRNPLAPMSSALELIRLRGHQENAKEHELLKRQVVHMSRLVDDLLDVAAIRHGKVVLKPEPSEIGSVVSRAVEMAESLLEERSHRLVIDIPEPIAWWGDPTRLAQVVANLLTNAARYTQPKGEIQISARREGDSSVRLTVTDNGQGIPQAMLGRVFELFVQGQRASDRVEGGLGLGLTLVKSLVELHQGRVEVTSDGPDLGTTFTVWLPLKDAPEQLAGPGKRYLTHPRRILIVDDNVDGAETLAEVLRMHDHEVITARDGAEGLERAGVFNPDIALLDIGLPVMDGYELARRIAQLSGPKITLIAVTGYGQAQDRARSAQAGFSAHLVKPVDLVELVQIVAQTATEA